ncbi:hypothetical protein HPB50_021821 [Hyalomma asiaticum]|uniref:Uncharacterized protein n=1 Tax=Hyalomma asiaticum TaxID=266040 RepID=A0ACB7RR48_HYAAI|nr:hypothetical protein HPB50_021821 [Hyalomma asiaticum]
MSRVPLHKREVVQLSLKGYTQRNIANLTDCNVSTVKRIVQAYRDEERIKDAPHKRRPRVTSMDQDLQVVAVVSEKPFLSAKDVRRTLDLANVSDSTTRRRLREAALRSRTAAQKPLLTCANKTARQKFAVDHRSWRVEDWKYVIFSDESTFSSRWDQQKRVWRMENTRFCPQDINEVAASGRTSANLSRLSLDLVTADELWEAMQEEWKRIQEDTAFIEALYRSLPERMEAVIQAGGAMTRY